MLTLYTAVGKLQIRKNSAGKEYPLVMVGEKERTLTPYEMLLWSSLSWNILTFDETRALFYEREQEMHILSDLDFEYYLKRLIFRGLVVSGTGYSGYQRPAPASCTALCSLLRRQTSGEAGCSSRHGMSSALSPPHCSPHFP